GIWEPATKIRLDLAIWYPANRIPTRLDYGDWSFRAARNAPPLPGQHPLVVLSHDSAGSRFSLHQLATALTRYGFVVAAPTHPGDNIDNMQTLFTPEQFFARARHLSATLDILLSDAEIAPLIDPQRIGVLGVGPGGTAALLLAGARLDATGWKNYCDHPEIRQRAATPREDPYCSPWGVQRMEALSATPGLNAAFRDRRVRVVVAVAPAYAMYMTPKALSRIRIPLLLINSPKNRMAGPPFLIDTLVKALPGSPVIQSLPDADTAALMSSCSENLAQTLPEMCFATSATTRTAVQKKLALDTAAFLLAQLGSPDRPPV
ncbi:MAG: hypothetical protein RR014_06625, partial [Bilophila sp.]